MPIQFKTYFYTVDSMYQYEGKDYSRTSEADQKVFDQLIKGIFGYFVGANIP